jgi:hypothetical protein
MKIVVVALMFVTLLLSPCFALLTEFEPGYQIATLVRHSDLVVVGTVRGADFAYREGIGTTFNTDITIAVDSLIKGETNAGEKTVKFMIQGGRGVDPTTGEKVHISAGNSPKFEVGERVLVFLKKTKRLELNYPYGGYFVYRGNVGKRRIVNDKFSMPYTFLVNIVIDGEMASVKAKKFIDLPVDLVIELGKASVKDFEGTKLLEEDIKGVISDTPRGAIPTIDNATVDRLKEESKSILDKEEVDKENGTR